MTFTAKADEMLKMLDPIIGVAGKGADVTFNVTSQAIEVSITNESKSALCRMSVDISEGMISGALDDVNIADDGSVTVNIDTLVGALKMFASRKVKVSLSGKDVVIECDIGKRTIRINENVKTSKSVEFKTMIEVNADPNDLKKVSGFNDISDSMYFDLHLGKFRIGCASDSETAEIYLETVVYQEHRSYYSSEIVSDVVRRIHCDAGDGVVISLSEDAPLGMTFDYGCASYWIFIAPRIKV